MLYIIEGNVSRLYEWYWDGENESLALRINRAFLDNNALSPQMPHISTLRSRLNLLQLSTLDAFFLDPESESFGFDGVLRVNHQTDDSFFELHAVIPEVETVVGECEECNGGRNRGWSDCQYCKGTGKATSYNWKYANAAIGSLQLVITALHFGQKVECNCKQFQLLTTNIEAAGHNEAGGLSGEFGIPLQNWLLGQKDNTGELLALPEAMRTVYEKCFYHDDTIPLSFGATVKDTGLLHITCPGNRSGLDPDDEASINLDKGFGYRYREKNLDTTVQILILLTALAVLSNLAKKDIDANPKEYLKIRTAEVKA